MTDERSGPDRDSVLKFFRQLESVNEVERQRPHVKFTQALGQIIVKRVRQNGSYWRVMTDLGFCANTANKWRKRGIAGEEPFASWWMRILRALRSMEASELGLTEAETIEYLRGIGEEDESRW